MFSKIRRPFRPMYRSALLAMLWANRRDVARWAKFAKRVATPASRPRPQDIKLEAKVRAALSSDPALRNDPSIRDVRVRDGVVVLEAPAEWHNKTIALARVREVKGVESVHTALDVNEQNWLDVDVIDVPHHAVV
jgi:osmotically-inducible protein OsmY